MTLSILIWLPLAVGLAGALLPARVAGRWAVLGALATVAIAVDFVVRYHTGRTGLQFLTDRMWISALGIHY